MAPVPESPQEPAPRPPVSLNGAEWGSSAAKRLIAQDMLDNLVPCDEAIVDVKALFEKMYENQPEFADFPFDIDRYKARISRLQKVVKKMKWASVYDKECLADYRTAFPQQSHGPTGKPLWRNSEADRLLKQDMADGLHETMYPRDLFATRVEYQAFGKTRFAKRIDQYREAAKPHGMNPMQAAAKKAKKEKKVIKDRPAISRLGSVESYSNV